MSRDSKKNVFVARLRGTTALIALGVVALPAIAVGQDASPPAAEESVDSDTVIIVGTRKSAQSAIDRQKRAKTATNSIVADDVGSFPDRNLNEAISRVAGVAIARDEFGEGSSVNLRGNSADFTRVEMDGMSVNSGGSDLAINGSNTTGGRAADMRELPAELIKSVDVVKGQTADMTEGGLGGSVLIKTRSGLDFKKPYFSLRVGLDQNSLSQKWSPDIGLVMSKKFLDDRLGVIFNLTSARRLNDSHQVGQAGSNNRQGYIRLYDLDGSPEKTFAYDPAAVSGTYQERYTGSLLERTPEQAMQSYTTTTNTAFDTNSALAIVQKSAAAQSKADCMSAFPLYSTAQLNTLASTTNRFRVQDQRIKEQVSCLNQWNDYVPNSVSDRYKTSYEDRLAWDIRFDYRVNDDLTLYAKYQVADRISEEYTRTRNRGFTDGGLTAGTYGTRGFVTNTNPAVNGGNSYITMTPADGFYLYNGGQPNGSGTRSGDPLAYSIFGIPANIVPGSVTVDESHHATQLTVTNIGLGYDNIQNDQAWKNNYLLMGGEFRHDNLSIDFQASRSEGTYERTDARFRRSVRAPTLTMKVTPAGLWVTEYPTGVDPDDITAVYPLQAATSAAAPRFTQNIALNFTPRMTDTSEDQIKFDITYDTPDLPFFKSFKTGLNARKVNTSYWGGGGFNPKSGVTVQTNQLAGNLRACEPTATSTTSCNYGYVPGTGINASYGTETITRAQLEDLYRQSVLVNDGAFMPGIDGFEGLQLWDSVDVLKAVSLMAGAKNFNLDCMKVCVGSDGNTYEQPKSTTTETITAAYYMAEFEQNLPWNLRFDGNFGVRMVQVETNGLGNVQIQSTTKNANWNDTTQINSVTTTFVTKPVSIQRTTEDWLPSYNANLWMFDDHLVLRYHWSKTVTRPPVSRLWPAGTCTWDERIADRIELGEDELDMGCGRFGNPGLRPYSANKANTSLEWYVNKDTFLSLAYYKQNITIGAPETYTITDAPLFEGTDEVDPNGNRLDSYKFTYETWRNGPGSSSSGWEFVTKAAFTALPWKLKHTGLDFNVSTNDTSGAATLVDPISGEALGAANRSDYFINMALWYDDGKTSARVSYQTRDAMLRCISNCGDSTSFTSAFSFPTQNVNENVMLPFNPGEPTYTKEYAYLDAKISHKVKPNVEVYLEGRNLLKEAAVNVGSRNFSGTEDYPFSYNYGGRRWMVGVTYKMN